MPPEPGRYCQLRGEREVSDLQVGMDFREPRYRREVFLRFWEFHLRHRTHPGCVYLLLPHMAREAGWDEEQRLWLAFVNGNTQNPVTSQLILEAFPNPDELRTRAGRTRLRAWWAVNASRLAFDTDRRYFRTKFPAAVDRYFSLQSGMSQRALLDSVASSPDERRNFRALWDLVTKRFAYFGRLSAFSFLEYLRIVGIPVECDQLFLHDLKGSRSHRNGLAKVLGRDDLDWHESNPSFNGRYDATLLEWLSAEAELLLVEQQARLAGTEAIGDVGYFTLESALCTYKSWYRPNRRYPNVYADMLVDRIHAGERSAGRRLDVFWEARRRLPQALRLEDCPTDPGAVPAKQNHYLRTGEVVMMDVDWPCFANSFNHGAWEV